MKFRNQTLYYLGLALLPTLGFAGESLFTGAKCKASYVPKDVAVVFTNRDLRHRGEQNYKADCAPLFETILKTEKLPVVSGKRVAAHLVYDLMDRDLFPTIHRLLDATRGGNLKIELRFSIGEDDGDPEEITTLEVDAMDRPRAE